MTIENTLLGLPEDIIKIIFGYLENENQVRFGSANRALRKIFQNNYKDALSKTIEDNFLKNLSKENIKQSYYRKIVYDTKEVKANDLINDKTFHNLTTSLGNAHNNFIQKKLSIECSSKKILKILPPGVGLLAAAAAFLAYSLIYFIYQPFYDGYVPAECSTKPNLSGCQNQVDKYFLNGMIYWLLLGSMVGFGIKTFDYVLSTELIALCFPACGLPDIKNSQLSNRTKHILNKLVKHRDFIALAIGLGLMLYLKISSTMEFNVENCVSEDDFWGLRFDVECIKDNVHQIKDDIISPIAACDGFFLAYSLFSVMKLCLYTAPKKTFETVKETYKQHGFFSSNQANENTYLLHNMQNALNV